MRRNLIGTAVIALALAAAQVPSVTAGPEGTGTVRAVVRYETPDRNTPLVGVEVWLGIDVGGSLSSKHACTDERGIARFADVPADTDLVSVTGVAVSPLRDDCTNPDFLNPDTGEEMTNVGWKGHHGDVTSIDTFVVGEGETVTLRFVARTPGQDAQLCGGAWVTWVGTAGNDRFAGTSDADVVNARGGNDTIRGAGSYDTICGGSGSDTLRGAGAFDMLLGESGNDTLIGGPGDDFVLGGPGRDYCRGEQRYGCE